VQRLPSAEACGQKNFAPAEFSSSSLGMPAWLTKVELHYGCEMVGVVVMGTKADQSKKSSYSVPKLHKIEYHMGTSNTDGHECGGV